MSTFDPNLLINLIIELRHPDTGCPWDREQALADMAGPVVDEANELSEALSSNDKAHICEETGDLLWNVLMVMQIAAEEGCFTMEEVVERVRTKMIGRHPHVFGEAKAGSAEEARKVYERAKRNEKL